MTSTGDSGEKTQQQLWDDLHGRQDQSGKLVGRSLVTEPNDLALILGERLSADQRVIEIGAANGRDARYWARHRGVLVYALDFSRTALDQLEQLAKTEGVGDRIITSLFDASTDLLPVGPETQNAFYARSALHVNDERLAYLLGDVATVLQSGGIVAIEGKHPNDPKILRSVPVDPSSPHLVSDPYEDDHIRRVWDPDYTREALTTAGFMVTDISITNDQTDFTDPSIFTRVIAVKG